MDQSIPKGELYSWRKCLWSLWYFGGSLDVCTCTIYKKSIFTDSASVRF